MGRYNVRETIRESSPAINLVFSRACEYYDKQLLKNKLEKINIRGKSNE